MKEILNAPFVKQMCKLTSNMYRMGWDERNGGNVSFLLDQEVVKDYLDINKVTKRIPINLDVKFLSGKIFIVTGTGKYFKNVEDDPSVNLGIIRVWEEGNGVDLLWGYEDGGAPTSELPSHLMTHIERLKIDPDHRVVIHTHATNIVAMTFVHDLTEREFTRTLWQMCTECMVVFPDGVGVLPWMLCGNDEIGQKTAEKMKEYRLVVWAHHGIFGTGRDIDETFGLIETVEKSAEIFIKIMHMPIKQTITDEQLRTLAKAFCVTPKSGFLNN
ncbi:MAG: Rhamnulose-phosphate aldolase [Oscillospiraceae bacterium]|nr:Rhamnulose-phosphate aldolase [Oscillospiraceae bacterium]